uniref:Uncharacterized protein n=1 Tax=Caenorhabditis tropicalis TaxID=1561998 RepID=A0A1I7THH5_9PELO
MKGNCVIMTTPKPSSGLFSIVTDCVNQLYAMYTLWKSFDEKEEVKKLMAKLPKPNTQIQMQHQHQHQSTSGYHM